MATEQTVRTPEETVRSYFDAVIARDPDAMAEHWAEEGIEATGRRVELRGADLLDIEDGKLVRNTAFYDGAQFARAIGLLPPQDSGAERAMRSAFNTVTKVRRAVAERS